MITNQIGGCAMRHAHDDRPTFGLRGGVALALLGLFLVSGLWAQAAPQSSFASAAEAAKALIEAAKGDDAARLKSLFGEGAEELLSSGDPVADKSAREEFVAKYTEKNALEAQGETRAILTIGTDDWPFPIPLVRGEKGWRFDTGAGLEELLNRRIGKNELDAIQTVLAIVDAQREYALKDWDGDGLQEYAERFGSTRGKKDGLYWEAGAGDPQSPLGPLVATAMAEGYSRKGTNDPVPYHGYYYRIVTAQGKHAPDGAYDYMVKRQLVGGFAVVAYPADYGNSGIASFLVNHLGVVYEKDLGEGTEAKAKAIVLFDPDPTWKKVDETSLKTP